MTDSAKSWQQYTLRQTAVAVFACAVPVFNFMAATPEFFTAHQVHMVGILGFFVVATLLPVAVSALIYYALEKSGKIGWRDKAHLALMGLSFLFAFLALFHDIFAGWFLALLVSAAMLWVYWRYARFGNMLARLAWPVVILVPTVYLILTPVKHLLSMDNDWWVQYPEITSRTPVVVLVFDELPLASLLDSHLAVDSAMFPNFSKLSRQATWYRNTTTVADATEQSIPAVLTGLYPDYKKSPKLKDYPQNFFTLLGGRYEMHIEEPRTWLCPDHFCRAPHGPFVRRWQGIFADTMAVYFHSVFPGLFAQWSGAPDLKHELRRDQQADHFIEGIHGPGRPVFYFMHLQLPHTPWVYLPTGNFYDNGSEDHVEGLVQNDTRWVDNGWVVTQAYQRHLLQLAYTDKILGRIVTRLKKTGLYDKALLIVTADRGIDFAPGKPEREATVDTLNGIAPVPLFIKLPGQKTGKPQDLPARTIDILPTLAGILNVDPHWRWDGRNLQAKTIQPMASRRIFHSDNVHFDLPPVISPMLSTVIAMKMSLFPVLKDSDDWHDLFEIGPGYGRYVGKPVSVFGRYIDFDPALLTMTIDNVADYRRFKPSDPYLPVRLSGKIQFNLGDHPQPGVPLLLAMDGRFVSVTNGWREKPADTASAYNFSFLLPKEALAHADPRLDVFVDLTTPNMPFPDLYRVQPASDQGRYIFQDKNLVLPDGRKVPMKTDHDLVSVKADNTHAQKLTLQGHFNKPINAERLLVFVDDVLFSEQTIDSTSPDFTLEFSSSIKTGKIRLVLLSDSVATEIWAGS